MQIEHLLYGLPAGSKINEHNSVRKYKSWEEFHQSNKFNSELKEVQPCQN